MNIFKTATITQSLVTIGSTLINGVFAALFYLLLARVLGPSEYGIFFLSITTIAISETFLDFGTDRGMVRYLSKTGDEKDIMPVTKMVFLYKLVVSFFVLLVCLTFSAPLSLLLFGNVALKHFLPVIGLGLVSQLLFYFVIYYAQAKQKYFWWGGLFVGTNALRLVITVVLLLMGKLTAISAVGLYGIVPLIGFLVGLKLTGLKFLNSQFSKSKFKEVFTFNAWGAGASSVGAVSSRLDAYVTARFLTLSQVGAYGLAGQAVMFIQQIISALGAVMGPKFASFSEKSANKNYLFKATLLSLGVALGLSVFMIPGGFLFFAISGSGYNSAFLPFLVLLVSTVVFLVSSPLRDSLLYFYGKPQFLFGVTVVQLVSIIVSGIYLIPRFGLLGSSLSNLTSQTIAVLLCVWYYRLQKSQQV